MVVVIVYMYRVIDSLHREQQVMRGQLQQLVGVGRPAPLAGGAPWPPARAASPAAGEFLEPHAETVAEAVAAMHGDQHQSLDRPRPGAKEHPHRVRGRPDVPHAEGRRLGQIYTTGTSAGVGCFTMTDQATESYDVSTTACFGSECPDCFITPATVSQDITLTISNCASASWIRSQTRSGVWSYMFINSDATYTVSVTDSTGAVTYKVPPSSYVQAWCTSSLGTANRFIFPSTTLPTLSVDNGLTVSAGNFDHSSSSGTFQTGSGDITLNGNVAQSTSSAYTFETSTGAVTLNGATTVADNTAFTVGSSTAGGASTFYGAVNIGGSASGASVATTIYGDITQNDHGSGVAATLSTATGAHSLGGDVTIASGKDLTLVSTGSGMFTTGTGQITLNGDVSQSGATAFSTGTGAVSLNGATTVADNTAFTVGSSTAGGAATFYGAVNIGGSASGASVATTIYGSITQNDDSSGTVATLATGTGGVTVNGDFTLAAAKNFLMTAGAGTFTTANGQALFKGDVLIDSTNQFTTGSGTVRLVGNVEISDGKSFTVGSAGNAGVIQLFGDTYVGGSSSGTSSSLTVYGDVAFNDDADGTTKTLTTATGLSQFQGDVAVAQDKNLHMHSGGTGTFQTGTGTVTLNGLVTVATGMTITIDSGTISCTNDNTATNNFCKAR